MTDRVRRNGQLSSCEPCRKSKLRCDHNRPICGRCVRRRLPKERCHYHPAPMVKQATAQRTPRQQIPESIGISSRINESQIYQPVNMNSNLMCFADPNTAHSQRSYTSLTRTSVILPSPSQPSQQTISEGATLLNEVLDLVSEIGESLQTFSIGDTEFCFQGPLVELSWKATDISIRNLLKDRSFLDERSSLNLDSISQGIFAQTSLPPFFPPAAAAGAFELALSQQSLRWELVGLYCAQIGVFLGGEVDKSFSFEAHKKWTSDRKTLMQRAFQACLQCESFCNQIGAVNDLTFWFLMLGILFATWCFGDDSYHVLRLQGSMTSVFLALGFHKGAQSEPSVPFYMAEIRKRGIAWAHDHDKTCASFISRPVRLSRHFCVIDMPLDLDDSAIMGTYEDFLKACESLDENGWNKSKAKLPVARWRVLLMLSTAREEALELKIGPVLPDLETKARNALRKIKSAWESVPSYLKYDPTRQWGGNNDTAISLQYLRLEYLYTEFLLHALLAGTSEMYRDVLIATAQEVVNLVLLPTRKRDFLQRHRADMEWTLVFYAMPCASVLVLELLRQNQNQGDQSAITNRSAVIQDISILIACCDSLTESGQSNFQICKQAQSIFSRSLDSILNPSEPTRLRGDRPDQSIVHTREDEQVNLDGANLVSSEALNAVVQDPEWMSWLDSLGLQGDPWLDTIVPTLEFPIEDSL